MRDGTVTVWAHGTAFSYKLDDPDVLDQILEKVQSINAPTMEHT